MDKERNLDRIADALERIATMLEVMFENDVGIKSGGTPKPPPPPPPGGGG